VQKKGEVKNETSDINNCDIVIVIIIVVYNGIHKHFNIIIQFIDAKSILVFVLDITKYRRCEAKDWCGYRKSTSKTATAGIHTATPSTPACQEALPSARGSAVWRVQRKLHIDPHVSVLWHHAAVQWVHAYG